MADYCWCGVEKDTGGRCPYHGGRRAMAEELVTVTCSACGGPMEIAAGARSYYDDCGMQCCKCTASQTKYENPRQGPTLSFTAEGVTIDWSNASPEVTSVEISYRKIERRRIVAEVAQHAGKTPEDVLAEFRAMVRRRAAEGFGDIPEDEGEAGR
jgi:hypothetical protein